MLTNLVSDGALHEVLLAREFAHPCNIQLHVIFQALPHTSQVVQGHACVEPLKKRTLLKLDQVHLACRTQFGDL